MRAALLNSSHDTLVVNVGINLVLLGEELGIRVQKLMRKSQKNDTISKCGVNDDEADECWKAVSEWLKEREV